MNNIESKIIRQNDKTTTIVKDKNDTSEIIQTMEGITLKAPIPKGKSWLIIGKERTFRIETDTKFNKFQKFMWKKCFNVIIEDIKE